MYIEWEDSDDLRLVTHLSLKKECIFATTVGHEGFGVIFQGTEKDALEVFNAIRKRMGVTLITRKWIEKVVARRWKGDD